MLRIHSLKGGMVGEQDTVGWSRQQTGYGYLRIKRQELVEELVSACKKAEIPIMFNKRITSIMEDDHGVTATFADGTSDTADFLLGCDGIHSQVRGLYVDPPQNPEYLGFSGLGAILSTSSLSKEAASQIWGLNATFTQDGVLLVVSCSASNDEFFWAFSKQVAMPKNGDSGDGWEVHRKQEVEGFKQPLMDVLKDAKGSWGSAVKEIIEKTSTVAFYPVYKLPLNRPWHKGRCVLVGDAAHAMPPHAGQGTSMAFEDVFLLSRLWEDPSRPFQDVFETYERIRRPRTNAISIIATQNAQIRRRSGPWGLWLKETLISIVFQVSWLFGLRRGVAGEHFQAYDIDKEPID